MAQEDEIASENIEARFSRVISGNCLNELEILVRIEGQELDSAFRAL
jgi:hypothetical protein